MTFLPPPDPPYPLTLPLDSATVEVAPSSQEVEPTPHPPLVEQEGQNQPPVVSGPPEAAPDPPAESSGTLAGASPVSLGSTISTSDRSGPIHPVPGVLDARQTHLFSGNSGCGKTSWVGWFLGQLHTQPTILGHPCNRPPFMAYVAGDRTINDSLEKLKASGWPNPAYYSLVDDHSSTASAYVESLCSGKGAAVKTLAFFQYVLKYLQETYFPSHSRIPKDSLIVIDGMAPFFGIEPAGSYLRAVGGPLIRLNQFCRSWGITVILVHHASKQKENDKYTRSQDRALGSMALQGFTSTQMFLSEPEMTGSDSHEFFWRSHSAPAETFDFRRHPETGVFEYVGPHWDVPDQPSVEVTDKPQPYLALLQHFSPHPDWDMAKSVHEELCPHITKSTFYRWIDQLIEGRYLERQVRDRTVWVRKVQAQTA